MSDPLETPSAEPSPGPADTSATSSARDDKNDIADALQEWDREIGRADARPQAELQSQPPAAPADSGIPWDHYLQLTLQADQTKVLQEQLLQQQFHEHWQRQERRDTSAVLKLADEYLDGAPPLPPDYAKRWIGSEYESDPELKAAWQNRRESPEAAAHAERLVHRALKKLAREARDTPDREATENRAAVTAAVRGSSGRVPEGRAPAYKTMNSQQFSQSVRDQFGFDPL